MSCNVAISNSCFNLDHDNRSIIIESKNNLKENIFSNKESVVLFQNLTEKVCSELQFKNENNKPIFKLEDKDKDVHFLNYKTIINVLSF